MAGAGKLTLEGYTIARLLGKGAFGQTYLARPNAPTKKAGDTSIGKEERNDLENQEVVIKVGIVPEDVAKAMFRSEVQMMEKLNHDNIVRLIKLMEKDEKIAIVMEYCRGGDLRMKIESRTKTRTPIPDELLFKWVSQIADALEHVHTLLLIHRDLKPENVFLTDKDDIKIGDFGITVMVKERSARVKGFAGTMFYAAPEMFDDQPYSYRCDLWAFGVMIYELVTLKKPFKDISKLMECDFYPLEDSVHPIFREIVGDLLQVDPSKRPRGDAILGRLPAQYQNKKRKRLDVAIIMDCTGSMEDYIENARQNIRKIAEQIVSKVNSVPRFALIEFRDHPPEEETFVTNSHDFTDNVEDMKKILDQCQAHGGGDTPEAVADGLFELTKLSWNADAIKVALLITDGPPHGIGCLLDAFPNGCPCGHDPMQVCAKLAKLNITLFVIGCEPKITPYRDIYGGLAHKTEGAYIELKDAVELYEAVIKASLQAVEAEKIAVAVAFYADAKKGLASDTVVVAREVYEELKSRGMSATVTGGGVVVTPAARDYAKAKTLGDIKTRFNNHRRNTRLNPTRLGITTRTESGLSEEKVARIMARDKKDSNDS